MNKGKRQGRREGNREGKRKERKRRNTGILKIAKSKIMLFGLQLSIANHSLWAPQSAQ